MKRLGRIWNDVLDLDNGFVAVVEGTANKRNHKETQRFYFSAEEVAADPTLYHVIDPKKAKAYAAELIEQLRNGTWVPKEPVHFRRYCRNKTQAKGKWRDLYVPAFDEHIVAHMVMQAVMPAFVRGMHPHCCGSVPGRGIRHIVRNVERWIRNDRECRYFVKLDIRHFFDNIDAEKLLEALRSHIKDRYVLDVFEKIIRSAPTACPVGYYTSPYFANLYLQKLDWYIEQELYKVRRGKRIKFVRHYLRYMDDMLLIGTSKRDLYKAVSAIRDYLRKNYGLELKTSWEVKRIGAYYCDIGGYKFCRDSTILRDGIFLACMRLARRMWKNGYYKVRQCRSLISRIGWSAHCDSFRFLERVRSMVEITTVRRIISCG